MTPVSAAKTLSVGLTLTSIFYIQFMDTQLSHICTSDGFLGNFHLFASLPTQRIMDRVHVCSHAGVSQPPCGAHWSFNPAAGYHRRVVRPATFVGQTISFIKAGRGSQSLWKTSLLITAEALLLNTETLLFKVTSSDQWVNLETSSRGRETFHIDAFSSFPSHRVSVFLSGGGSAPNVRQKLAIPAFDIRFIRLGLSGDTALPVCLHLLHMKAGKGERWTEPHDKDESAHLRSWRTDCHAHRDSLTSFTALIRPLLSLLRFGQFTVQIFFLYSLLYLVTCFIVSTDVIFILKNGLVSLPFKVLHNKLSYSCSFITHLLKLVLRFAFLGAWPLWQTGGCSC